MYLHLGGEKVVKTKDIIGIFDMDTSTVSKNTRDYLNKAEKNGEVVTVSFDLPKLWWFAPKSKGKKRCIYLKYRQPHLISVIYQKIFTFSFIF